MASVISSAATYTANIVKSVCGFNTYSISFCNLLHISMCVTYMKKLDEAKN